jgi:putative drug exporter of the RND superfamily
VIGVVIVALLALANKRFGVVGGVTDFAFQQMGSGVAVAVLIDATRVRAVLLPAAMQLRGTRNWSLPSWLSRLPALEPADVSAAATKPC